MLDDFAFVVADVSQQSLTVYDNLQDRQSDKKLLSNLKLFINDYVDEYGNSLFLTEEWQILEGGCYKDH